MYQAKQRARLSVRGKAWKAAVAVAGAVLITGLSLAAGGAANATTLTCTNTSAATVSPFGCGGIQVASTTHGTLDLAHTSNIYNALVTVQPDASVTSEDWTAFALGGIITGGPGGLGAYVAMDTPLGRVPQFTVTSAGVPNTTCLGNNVPGNTYFNTYPCPGAHFVAGASDFCLSVEHVTIAGKFRWYTVLRNCSTNGTFVYGDLTHPGAVSFSFANRYQLWAPINTGDQGLAFDNVFLFSHTNVDHLLNVQGNGPAGARVIAWPETGTAPLWEQWDVIGCTPPASILPVPAAYVNCP